MEQRSAPVNCLQRRRMFTIKNQIISTQPKRPNQGKHSHPNENPILVIYPHKPVAKHISHSTQWIQVGNHLDD
jgi:hypothetical protein